MVTRITPVLASCWCRKAILIRPSRRSAGNRAESRWERALHQPCQCLETQGEFDRAVPTWIRRSSSSLKTLLPMPIDAIFGSRRRNLKRRYIRCDDAIRRDPSYPSAYVDRGNGLFQGELDPALKDFRTGHSPDPSMPAPTPRPRRCLAQKAPVRTRAISGTSEQAIKLNPKLAASHTTSRD